MTNANDYLAFRGDLGTDVAPICELDVFLCSQLIAPDYTGIVPTVWRTVPLSRVAERYFETHSEDFRSMGILQSEFVLPLLKKIATYPRFADVRVGCYRSFLDRTRSEQFCAVTFLFPTGETVVIFRGTDDTIAGWRENFNLAVMEAVPAQEDAKNYLSFVASRVDGPLYVTGHSKGGNLAVYAAACVPKKLQEKITRVYAFDSPGFREHFLASGGYLAVRDRILSVVSNNSIVGLLLGYAGKRVIVHAMRTGPIAHDGFYWEASGTSFVRTDALSRASSRFDLMMDEFIDDLAPEEAELFVDELFDALESTGAVTVTDLTRISLPQALAALHSFRRDARMRRLVRRGAEIFLRTFLKPDAPMPKRIAPPKKEDPKAKNPEKKTDKNAPSVAASLLPEKNTAENPEDAPASVASLLPEEIRDGEETTALTEETPNGEETAALTEETPAGRKTANPAEKNQSKYPKKTDTPAKNSGRHPGKPDVAAEKPHKKEDKDASALTLAKREADAPDTTDPVDETTTVARAKPVKSTGKKKENRQKRRARKKKRQSNPGRKPFGKTSEIL